MTRPSRDNLICRQSPVRWGGGDPGVVASDAADEPW